VELERNKHRLKLMHQIAEEFGYDLVKKEE